MSSRPEESQLRALPDPYVNLSIHTAPMFGRFHDRAAGERRALDLLGVAGQTSSCPLWAPTQPLELAAHPADDIEIDPLQGRTQLRSGRSSPSQYRAQRRMVDRAQAHSATLVRRAGQGGTAGGVKARNRLALPGRMSPLAFVANDRSPPLETTRPASTNHRDGDEERFKVRKRDGDEGGEAPLKVVPSAGPARRACRDARVVLGLKEANLRPAGRGHDGEGPRSVAIS